MPPANELTIDDEIASDWKAIQAKHAEPAPEPAATEVADELSSEPSPEDSASAASEAAPAADKPRSPDGKFAKATDKPVEAAPASETPPEPEAPVTPTRDINRAPSTWKPAAKAAWAALPPDIRAEVHRRESDFLSGQSKLLPDAKFGQSIRTVIEPYRMLIEAEGGTPEKAVGDLMRTAAMLRMGTPEQKLGALQAVARQYGVNLTPPDPQAPVEPQQGQYRDPRVDQMLAEQRQQEMQRQAQERAAIETVAEQWINEANADGSPIRPYIDNVMAEMNALVPQIRAADPSLSHKDVLQTAYDRAIWAHPEIRPILLKEQADQLEAKRRTENQERVNLAKKASSVNVPRRGSIPAPSKPGSMDDTIRESARALGFFT